MNSKAGAGETFSKRSGFTASPRTPPEKQLAGLDERLGKNLPGLHEAQVSNGKASKILCAFIPASDEL
jgi:hypothetical protein